MAGRTATSLTCVVCHRTFNRGEHLRRHLRTHTREKPYHCHCGQSFARRDLLTRHERLYHSVSSSAEASSPGSRVSTATPVGSSGPIHGLDVVPSPASLEPQGDPAMAQLPVFDNQFPSHDADSQSPMWSAGPGYADLSEFVDIYNPYFSFDFNLQNPGINYGSLREPSASHRGTARHWAGQEVTSRPHSGNSAVRIPDTAAGDDDFHELKPMACPWVVPEPQRASFAESLKPLQHVTGDFKLPSRMSLSRYIAGYVDGFSSHHPFIHMPSFCVTQSPEAPEMILALLAMGAQFRYEYRMASALYEAARAIILHRLRNGELRSPIKTSASLPSNALAGQAVASTTQPVSLSMDSVRAVLLMGNFSSWQHDARLTRESLDYQAVLARCVRDSGLTEPEGVDMDQDDWHAWASLEVDRRTKLSVFCFLNLQSLVFHSPPVLLGKDINLQLPSSCEEWTAPGPSEWHRARSRRILPISFQTAMDALLKESGGPPAMSSPFGNYALAHALLQRILIVRQLSALSPDSILKLPGTVPIEESLHRWRDGWHRSPESIIDTRNPSNSLSWSSTSLVGLAHIRLHFSTGDGVFDYFDDPERIAKKALQAGAPKRGPHLLHALLHAVHGLNVPIQTGIALMSNCQGVFWSLQHAFSAFEFAVFLGSWLASFDGEEGSNPPDHMEQRIVNWLASLAKEALDTMDEMSDLANLRNEFLPPVPVAVFRRLSVVVVRLFALMFTKSNSVWPVTKVIGEGLTRYAVSLSGVRD